MNRDRSEGTRKHSKVRRRRINFPLAACLAVLTLFGACQKKGSPQPPNPTTGAIAAASTAGTAPAAQ